MASRLDISGYKAVLKVRKAYAFDIGTCLMRIFQFTITVGMVSTLTLAGYSAFWAGTVASLAAVCTFLITPRVSRLIDVKGQSSVVPKAIALTVAGLAVILGNVALHGPIWVCYIGCVLLGFLPSGPSLPRARWTYLLESGRLGDSPPELKTIYAYEGLIEDISFMIGPAVCIGLNTAIAPIAGMTVLGCGLVLGTVLLVSSKSTEPDGEFRAQQAVAAAPGGPVKRTRSMFVESGAVRMLFLGFVLMGTYYGVLNTTEVAFTQELGVPGVAGNVMMCSAIVSALGGFVFGMLRLNVPLRRLYVVLGVIVGLGYTFMIAIHSIPALYAVSCIPIILYAPFLITSNSMCQACVPKERLTESLTWLNTGTICGMAIGPTLAGSCIDGLGVHAGFVAGGTVAFALAVAVLLSALLWRRYRQLGQTQATEAGE